MMRGPRTWAVAARRPDGEIVTTDDVVPAWVQRPKDVPIVRGMVALVETMQLGLRALRWSAGVERGETDDAPPARGLALATVVTLAVFVAVFAAVPAAT